jgi:hypothetical protein
VPGTRRSHLLHTDDRPSRDFTSVSPCGRTELSGARSYQALCRLTWEWLQLEHARKEVTYGKSNKDLFNQSTHAPQFHQIRLSVQQITSPVTTLEPISDLPADRLHARVGM